MATKLDSWIWLDSQFAWIVTFGWLSGFVDLDNFLVLCGLVIVDSQPDIWVWRRTQLFWHTPGYSGFGLPAGSWLGCLDRIFGF